MNSGSDPYKLYHFPKDCNKNFQIHVICFNRLRFLVEVRSKLSKMHFFGQFKDRNSESKHGNYTNYPSFLSTFSVLFVIFIFIFQNGQVSFSCGHSFGLFWSVKYLNFGQKLPIRTAHHTFLESRHPEVTKNSYYVLIPQGESMARGLIPMHRGVYIHYFKINLPILCCPLFSENYLSPQVRINKMVNKHTLD